VKLRNGPAIRVAKMLALVQISDAVPISRWTDSICVISLSVSEPIPCPTKPWAHSLKTRINSRLNGGVALRQWDLNRHCYAIGGRIGPTFEPVRCDLNTMHPGERVAERRSYGLISQADQLAFD
jgi:hypothetical protein